MNREDAITKIDAGSTVKVDMDNGYVVIKKKVDGMYDIRIYTASGKLDELLTGGKGSLLRVMNRLSGFYIEGE